MTDYQKLLDAVEKYYGSWSDEWVEIAKYGVSADNAEAILTQVPGVNIVKNADGTIRSYNLDTVENLTESAIENINSNAPADNVTFSVPSNTGIDTAGKMTFASGLSKAGNFVFGEIVPALAATAAGITLGKTIDSLLYKANPDFWDEHGMSTINPDTWNSITSNDTFGGRVFNAVFGLNPDNSTQAYMDENVLAYMSLYLQNKGVFATPKVEITPDDEFLKAYPQYANAKVYATTGDSYTINADGNKIYSLVANNESEVYKGFQFFNGSVNVMELASLKPFKYTNTKESSTYHDATRLSVLDKYIYCNTIYGISYPSSNTFSPIVSHIAPNKYSVTGIWQYIAIFGHKTTGGLDGVGTQEGAKTPDLSNADTVEDVLNALKSQYPELFNNAVTQDVVQPDGSTVTYTYVPVAMPELDPEGNPISSTSTQANPQVNPATAPESLLDALTKLIARNPDVNPPDTGTGTTPIVPAVTGSASALYAIYNPTLTEINSFGAWLWSDNFIEQIKKLFSDPMQAIIGLHKVFATPATGGKQNIKVGYLDSGVSANIVSNQYSTIDCGTVKLSEQFHNVFDYSPYTQVSLYLPFIGIVNLDVSDVMRSSINIVYHVDVFSGACLAEVKITRDSAGGTLYQYAGNAAVTLPISSGSYMGIVASIASIAGGVAGTIASGGAAVPMLASAAGSALNARTRVEHSGSFSGNAGAMGSKKPYLIISRPQTALADNFNKYIGYPSNFTQKLSACKGFVKVVESHLENVPATDSELSEIDNILKEGVLI